MLNRLSASQIGIEVNLAGQI